jgi:unsaturated rhamnogalacturonyl hydrolase
MAEMHLFRKTCALLFIAALSAAATAAPKTSQPKEFGDWPAGTSPTEIGKRVAERFVASGHLRPNEIIYPEVCAWYGSLTYAQLAGDKDLQARLIKRFEPLMGPEESGLVSKRQHVDFSVFGTVPLELYIQTKDKSYLELGQGFADRQWATPDAEGLTSEARFWIDDMFMITILEVQAYRATGDTRYIDRAALAMAAYLDKLQQPNGLFFHAPDVPFYWGRGNGWVAVGLAELLRSLPEKHPKRERILKGYRTMMKSILKYQSPEGTWRQLMDKPESWAETSSTGMFTFALVTGVKGGWLDRKTYAAPARKAWLGLVKYINADSDVTDVCEGTNKKNDLQYYLDRKRKVGDLHGQSPILWTASAFLR